MSDPKKPKFGLNQAAVVRMRAEEEERGSTREGGRYRGNARENVIGKEGGEKRTHAKTITERWPKEDYATV